MSPANGTTNVPIAGTLTITFSEQLVGTGTVIAQLNGTALTMTTTNSTQFNAAYTGLTNNTNYNVYFSSFAGLTDK